MQKADKAKKQCKPDDPPESQTLSETVSDQHLNETSDSLNSSIQINQNEILLSLTFHSNLPYRRRYKWNLRMPNKTTVTKILAQQQNVQIAFQRQATPLLNQIINKKISKTNSISPKKLTEIL
ncbi:Hypothetical_protein [Hexamita inflata]|uniref:Hypothetical_protein n=1 Tax=Hexamita inflata TaxID=28002 RepID=A0AA86RAC8_9EUKA|nr:Hypothetical protein HINF_LOCUS62434 [Hexamita inflata]